MARLAPVIIACSAANGILSGLAAPIDQEGFDRCRTIVETAARLHCFESLTSDAPRSPSAASPLSVKSLGKWRLVRTPHPQGGHDAVSVMRSGEFAGSDPDFAGLMLRCGESDIEVLLAVIKPFGAREHPAVDITSKGGSGSFTGSVAPPGALVLLPEAVTKLARSIWPTLPEVSFSITADEGLPIHGRVLLNDLSAALTTLQANCADR